MLVEEARSQLEALKADVKQLHSTKPMHTPISTTTGGVVPATPPGAPRRNSAAGGAGGLAATEEEEKEEGKEGKGAESAKPALVVVPTTVYTVTEAVTGTVKGAATKVGELSSQAVNTTQQTVQGAIKGVTSTVVGKMTTTKKEASTQTEEEEEGKEREGGEKGVEEEGGVAEEKKEGEQATATVATAGGLTGMYQSVREVIAEKFHPVVEHFEKIYTESKELHAAKGGEGGGQGEQMKQVEKEGGGKEEEEEEEGMVMVSDGPESTMLAGDISPRPVDMDLSPKEI